MTCTMKVSFSCIPDAMMKDNITDLHYFNRRGSFRRWQQGIRHSYPGRGGHSNGAGSKEAFCPGMSSVRLVNIDTEHAAIL